MNVAINGDRGGCLTKRLAPGLELFAIANGFGTIDGAPASRFVIERVRTEFDRRTAWLQREKRQPKNVGAVLVNALSAVNTYCHVRSASHDDYITAACSLTVALSVDGRAYVAHAGTTAAYLVRNNALVTLTKGDALAEDGALPVLTRAVGTQAALQFTMCSFALNAGDALILAGKRLRRADLLLASAQPASEQLVIVRYEETAPPEVQAAAAIGFTVTQALRAGAIGVSILTLLCLH